jgi:acid phosphatase type 7
VVFCMAMLLLLGCVEPARQLPPCDRRTELPNEPRDPDNISVVSAGDIANCATHMHEETAMLVDNIAPDAVLTLGDTVYPNGSISDFLDCYHPSWGRFRSITRAAVGNHEYHTPHAAPFYAYFCSEMGVLPLQGRYSFNLGKWHVVVLNSNCGGDLDTSASVADNFGGCEQDAPQAQWLTKDLAQHPAKCTLAMWHHPRFSSGSHGNADRMAATWTILEAAGADLVLSGHAHFYERFAPMRADGELDAAHGLRQFVVGTGGTGLHTFSTVMPGSAVRYNATYGVLKLDLKPTGYRWKFIATGTTPASVDEGEAECHD